MKDLRGGGTEERDSNKKSIDGAFLSNQTIQSKCETTTGQYSAVD